MRSTLSRVRIDFAARVSRRNMDRIDARGFWVARKFCSLLAVVRVIK
jgi:hypothetical protein